MLASSEQAPAPPSPRNQDGPPVEAAANAEMLQIGDADGRLGETWFRVREYA
jgi:hypothetical protein